MLYKNWKIRLATTKDTINICECFKISINEICSKNSGYTDEMIHHWNSNKIPSKIEEWITNQNHIFFVAENAKSIEGVAFLNKVKGELTACYLLPSATRQGLGKKLIEIMLEEFKNLKIKRVTLGASLNAKKFYEKLGFSVYKKHLNQLPPKGIPYYSMEKLITCKS